MMMGMIRASHAHNTSNMFVRGIEGKRDRDDDDYLALDDVGDDARVHDNSCEHKAAEWNYEGVSVGNNGGDQRILTATRLEWPTRIIPKAIGEAVRVVGMGNALVIVDRGSGNDEYRWHHNDDVDDACTHGVIIMFIMLLMLLEVVKGLLLKVATTMMIITDVAGVL